MARVGFAWELGGGMGHTVPFISLARALKSKGHEVVSILKDMRQARLLRETCDVVSFQAPLKTWKTINPYKAPLTYPHILHNSGFDDRASLVGIVEGWRALFDAIKPDIVLFEHCPTGLLAARGFPFGKVVIGTGFTIPPTVYPLPNLRFWLKPDQQELRRSEDFTLNTMNDVLGRLRVPPLNHLSDLWESATQILKTFKELDPYQERRDADYYGTSASPMGEDPSWPEGKGKKVFAYLKPFPTLPALLSTLGRLEIPSIVYVERIPPKLKEKFTASTIKFASAPQDMGKIVAQCDMAILNGTHNTSVNLLLAGKPALHLPIYLEQFLTAHKIEKLEAGLSAPTLRPEEMTVKLEMMLRSDSYAEGAQRFASRYAGMNAAVQDERVFKTIEGLLVS